MIRIDTISDLRAAWSHIITALRYDLGAAHRLAADPIKTLEKLGYQVGREAQAALMQALP